MTDECDEEFFMQHVWPLLLKDVRLLIADEGSSLSPTSMASMIKSKFMVQRFTYAQLAAHRTAPERALTAERELKLAGMQAYALMYEVTMTTTRSLIDEDRGHCILEDAGHEQP